MKTGPTAQPKLYIGIDIHKRSWKVHCATELFGDRSLAMPPRPEVLQAYVTKHFPGHRVTTAYEAGCCGYYAHRSSKYSLSLKSIPDYYYTCLFKLPHP